MVPGGSQYLLRDAAMGLFHLAEEKASDRQHRYFHINGMDGAGCVFCLYRTRRGDRDPQSRFSKILPDRLSLRGLRLHHFAGAGSHQGDGS
jgi:hypothetical protein